MEAARSRWVGLVRRWRGSGQTAREFADRAGVNAGTLAYWAWRLKRETPRARGITGRPRSQGARAAGPETRFVELVVDRQDDGRFVLELADGQRLGIPPAFDAAALQRLLTVLRPVRE